MTVAMAGKGGTGKTTIAGLLIRFLLKKGIRPILAVDADPNANLNEVLGLEVETTVGAAREGMKSEVPAGMTRDLYMEYKVQDAVIEGEGFDMIVMGRPEGPGCYCHANTLLSWYMEKLCANYRVVVMDNEAGMEHISRLLAKRADILLIVSDPTQRGIRAAKRISDLAGELDLHIRHEHVIVNRVNGELSPALKEAIDASGLSLAGSVPEDNLIARFDTEGRPTADLPADCVSVKALDEIFEKVIPI